MNHQAVSNNHFLKAAGGGRCFAGGCVQGELPTDVGVPVRMDGLRNGSFQFTLGKPSGFTCYPKQNRRRGG
jgi:hypothetical protein